MASIHVALDLIRMDADSEGPSSPRCSGCHRDLALHQPDPQSPDRLLGTCEECHAWFLILAVPGLMIRLPDEQDLPDASPAPIGRPQSSPRGRSAAKRGRPR